MADPNPVIRPKAHFWTVAVFILGYVALFLIPGWVFFSERSGLTFLDGANLEQASRALFPLFGLYAFFFVWAQVMLRVHLAFRFALPAWFDRFHRVEGVFALLFALLHPLFLVMGVGLQSYFAKDFVAPELAVYVLIGQVQLLLLIVTAGTALLRNLPWLRTRWRVVHYLNYVVFILAWIHSWNLGTDVQSTGLRWLWIGIGLTGALVILVRVVTAVRARLAATGRFVRVAGVNDLHEGKSFCANVNGRAIAVYNVSGAYFATDSRCSHANGQLCRGRLDGLTIECPLHRSRFDLRTGVVLNPPATEPVKTHQVRVRGESVEVAI